MPPWSDLVTNTEAWISRAALVPADSITTAGSDERAAPQPRRGRGQPDRGRGSSARKIPRAFRAFRIANAAMARRPRRRSPSQRHRSPTDVASPTWRPFQLAFILMNLPGIVDPDHADREIVDLLFFPTGGGKTEAYLGLAAFTLVYRRLQEPGRSPSAGLSVLMRYTLRLLTLDQLGRAAALICALESSGEQNPDKLGPWPFEIGLWVGRAATPNRMGGKGDDDPDIGPSQDHRVQERRPQASADPARELPLVRRRSSSRDSFQLCPNQDQPDRPAHHLRRTDDCDFTRDQPLPILAVDEPIYRRLPCFLIATVDKFAAMPWTGRSGRSSAGSSATTQHGFYGPCDAGTGGRSPRRCLPPDLIIQDELHLISGPLGTMVGLYETALDELCCRTVEGKKVRPKIVASTATVRRAEKQIRPCSPPVGAISSRRPGPTAATRSSPRPCRPGEPARLYLGVAAQGRSLKVVLLRTYLAFSGRPRRPTEATAARRTGQPGRPLHDAARLLQQPARAGRQPPHRRGRGRTPG